MSDNTVAVKYAKDGVIISVESIKEFGKNPGLWIGTEDPNQYVKVASFGSEDKARLFCKWLDFMIGVNTDRKTVKWDAAD